MPISDDTAQRIQALMDKAAEIIKRFPSMNHTEALLCANSVMTVREIIEIKRRAEEIDKRQELVIAAEKRAKAAYAATYKSNIESDNL